MNIGQPSHGRRPLVEHVGHPRRASIATSDCWQSPQLRGGLDHAPVRVNCTMKVFSTIAKQVISARSGDRGDRGDREVRDVREKMLGKCPHCAHASLHCIPRRILVAYGFSLCEPRYESLLEQKNQAIKTRGKKSIRINFPLCYYIYAFAYPLSPSHSATQALSPSTTALYPLPCPRKMK